ncbi:MAG: hypothetical protein NTV30_10950 [Chloroflexi bacterium]|nr:hypothetical protein [Chloroflexota bacterium]
MADVKEHIEKIANVLGAANLPQPFKDMMMGWLKNRPSEELYEKLSVLKKYLNEQPDIK